jgi:DNA-binding FadR family transcriptional regulator
MASMTGIPRGRGSAHAAVAQAIGRGIVHGEHPPGTILPPEAEWSARFHVSRSVVREAIKILSAKGLLTSRPKVGSRVEPREHWNLLDHDVLAWYAEAPGRKQFLGSLQEFRRIFEPEAAALAAERRSDEQMQAISNACHDMGQARSLSERSAADVRFHLAILDASGNDLLLPLGVLVESALRNLFVMITREAADLRHAQGLHEAIERAIRQRRPAAARRAVKGLLENSDAMVLRVDGARIPIEPN